MRAYLSRDTDRWEGLKRGDAQRTVGSPSPGKARELMRNAKTYDKHISQQEHKRVGENGEA